MPTSNPDREPPLVQPAGIPQTTPARWYVRVALILLGVGLATVFGVATWLDPYDKAGQPRSIATHTQLGVPPCNFLQWTGKPCPACGMTTSFALLVRGDVGASLNANWVGTLLAVVWAVLLPWAVASGMTGRILFVPRGRTELLTTVLVGFFLVLMLVRWGLVLLR